jgi:putative ABC transport system permease protein
VIAHYVRFALRLLRRSPAYTAITIGGFAVALASCILVLLFVRHELGYDAWLRDADQLYRVHMRLSIPGREATTTSHSLGPLHERLVADPAVAASGRLLPFRRVVALRDGRSSFESIALVDRSLFDVLELPMARGERRLADPSACLVTERFAARFFGDVDPMGRTLDLRVNGSPVELRVVGVLRDLPVQTHLELEIVALLDPLDQNLSAAAASWENVFGYTYVKLREGADPAAVEQRLAAALAANVPDIGTGEQKMHGRDLFAASLAPVRDLHLHAVTDADRDPTSASPPGDPTTIYAIAGVGLLLLAIAIGNFVNLTTARAGRRAREIAIRKAAGAQRRDIVVQYLGEAVLIAVIALVLALMLVELVLPWFERLAARELDPPHDPALLGALAGAAVGLGLLSGIYPALVLARYQPAVVMNQNQGSVAFAAAIALAFGTVVVYRQARYAADVNLGFAKHDRLVIQGVGSRLVHDKLDVWLDRMAKIRGVEGVSLASDMPGLPSAMNTMIKLPDAPGPGAMLHFVRVDYDLFSTLDIPMLAGRGFSRAVAGDDVTETADHPLTGELSLILNQAAVRRLGLGTPAQAVGRAVELEVDRGRVAPFRVIGVVPDVQFGSMRDAVEPTVFTRERDGFWMAVVRFAPGTGPAVRGELEALWRELFPERPFSAEYADVQIDALYRNEQRLATILSAAALLALAVACLGLYGLTAFLAESRRKEIAIRKVLGASTADVIRLLAWKLARPIGLACALAIPLAYFVAERWLAGFAYRIEIGAGSIAATLAGALAIAAATVAAQSLRSANARPVDALHAG